MKKIFKYQLELVNYQKVEMPKGAKIIAAQFQTGVLCMWAEVSKTELRKEVGILIYGTGHELGITPKTYISTVQDDGFVWHVYRQGLF